MKTTVSVTEAQKQLPRLLRGNDVVCIMRHQEIAGFFVPRDQFNSLLETVATLANPDALQALKKFESGKMRFRSWKQAKRELK
jgi:PHD/YefM family antitoxin component YafN of YafNO toxin-antitoxin module